MSVFRVKLNNTAQGRLDIDPTTGAPMTTSIQRTIYVAGPKRTHRKLADGETFTDSNYWKRFAYPQVSLADAFIEVVTDDGSVYSDVDSENTFPVVYDLTLVHGTTYTAEENIADILTDHGASANFVQITNQGNTACKVKLNGSASAIFDLAGGDTQVFNNGDLQITKLEFANTTSGGAEVTVQVIASVKSVSNS
ncbi:MAG: hypothetical protein EKK64_03225 [Neisseriaceae bacterium]|nr:MAG: hypothetical protein EKK64_03225 [Neisseriaceae bacterium]